MEYDYIFKVLVLGDRGVGKTTLINQLADNGQANNADIKIRTKEIEGKTLKLEIWNSVGLERFGAMTVQFCREARGVLIVYDVTNQISFDNVQNWVQQLARHGIDTLPKILVGSNADNIPDRKVTFDEGQNQAEVLEMHFFETNTLNNWNVEEALTDIATQMKVAHDPQNVAHELIRNRVKINDPGVKQNGEQGIWGCGC